MGTVTVTRMASFKDVMNTGSRSGKILNWTVALLQSVLYAPKFIVVPKPIQ